MAAPCILRNALFGHNRTIKQINNLKLRWNKDYEKFQVVTPDGRVWEEFDSETEACAYMRETKDFVKRK